MRKLIIAAIMILTMGLTFTGCDDSMYEEEMESSTNTRCEEDLDAENVTILVYMVASDLESEGGCATTDINEMSYAELSDNINVVLQTGGAKSWNNNIMDASKVERYEVSQDGLTKVGTVGKCKQVSMTDPNTLADFLKWGMKKYPADRYGVILWDHGGGSVMGYGSDEYHSEDMMGIDKIRKAFKKAKAKVNFIGFDACLMGTIETSYALSNYADYMVASEETEPGTGWYYTDWLTLLSENPGVNMKELGKSIIGSYVNGDDASFWDDLTLAVYDLKDTKKTYKALSGYLAKTKKVIRQDGGIDSILDARTGTRSYGDDEFEQIDIRSYMDKAGVEDENLTAALEDMIVYYGGNTVDSTGMAMYYPYSNVDYYSEMETVLDNIGMDNEQYRDYFEEYLSVLAMGKRMNTSSAASQSPAEQLTGTDADSNDDDYDYDYENEDWYDEDAAESGYSDTALFKTDEELTFTEDGDNFLLKLSDKQWNAISKVEMELYVPDGDGYLFFGRDSLVDYNDDGDLIAGFDFNWVSLDGQIVPFYIVQDVENGDAWQATGYIPAVLNADTDDEEDINIYVRWDSDHEGGYLIGYAEAEDDDDTSMHFSKKNYLKFNKGDTLDFYCDYYNEDGEYDDEYFVGDTLKIGSEEPTVEYTELDDVDGVQISYQLTDKYGNKFWTEMLEY